ncbi:MAG: PQQ-binding-like beta-propeller repeat protein [Rhodobacteraceae bacterium]|nr:PQQ-binding-like beta-propeller repeat protein [Paracoccaceae bacterium]
MFRTGFWGLGLLLGLAACDQDATLEGERFGTRVPLAETFPADINPNAEVAPRGTPGDTVGAGPREITLPPPVVNADWMQRAANIRNLPPHVALSAAPQEIWAVAIGQGNSRRNRITADPVVTDGRIFTLDADAGVRATATSGGALWSVDLTPGFEHGSGGASGGALAVAGPTVFATTGYGELVALNVADGSECWRQRLGAGITAPTIANDTAYIVSRDNQAWAIDISNGRIRWQLPAAPTTGAVLSGGAAPAITDRLVIFPLGSGELVGALRLSGVRVWATTVAGGRRGVAYNNLADITADPVVDGDVIYVGNQSGRVVALEAASGQRIWTATDGAYSPVLPVGDSVFFVSDRNELVRLDAETGARIWGTDLPLYVRNRERRRKAVFTHFGPILAGDRLVVGSGDGLIRMFAPESGELVLTLPLPGGAAASPVVAGGVLYAVSTDGRLHAYR